MMAKSLVARCLTAGCSRTLRMSRPSERSKTPIKFVQTLDLSNAEAESHAIGGGKDTARTELFRTEKLLANSFKALYSLPPTS